MGCCIGSLIALTELISGLGGVSFGEEAHIKDSQAIKAKPRKHICPKK